MRWGAIFAAAVLCSGAGVPNATRAPLPGEHWTPDYAAHDQFLARWGAEPIAMAAKHRDVVRALIVTNEMMPHFLLEFSKEPQKAAVVELQALSNPKFHMRSALNGSHWNAVLGLWRAKRHDVFTAKRPMRACIAVLVAELDVAEDGKVFRAMVDGCEPQFVFANQLMQLAVKSFPVCAALPREDIEDQIYSIQKCEALVAKHK